MFDPYDDAEYHATKLKPSHPPNLVDLRDGGRQKRKHDFEEEQRTKSVKLATVRTDKQIPIKQTVSFITKPSEIMPELWRSLKKLQKQVCLKDDLSRFGNKSLNLKLLDSKVKVMAMDQEVVARARRLANPYERIGNSIFINRAAVKLANIDSIYNLIPTSTPLLFADLCSGPGGFAEYILWKSKQSKGWGITLRGNQDYKFVNQKFIPVYGDGSGDLYKVANIDLFVDRVLKDTMKESESIAKGGGGADLCLGDGGFSVLGDEQYVEHHSRHLILSQILTMFSILRKGGNFVLKVFDILTNFSVEAVYLLYLFFEKISIIKPFSSRSGNSERYLVCLNLQVQRPTDLIEYLKTVLTCFNDLKPTLKQPKSAHSTHQPGFVRREEMIELGLLEVTDILDIDKVVKDEVFIDAITGSNMKLAVKQKDALDEIYGYAMGKTEEWDQKKIARLCCEEWKIPQPS